MPKFRRGDKVVLIEKHPFERRLKIGDTGTIKNFAGPGSQAALYDVEFKDFLTRMYEFRIELKLIDFIEPELFEI